MTRPGKLCRCWRMSPHGYHMDRACDFYPMHWREVAAEIHAEIREDVEKIGKILTEVAQSPEDV